MGRCTHAFTAQEEAGSGAPHAAGFPQEYKSLTFAALPYETHPIDTTPQAPLGWGYLLGGYQGQGTAYADPATGFGWDGIDITYGQGDNSVNRSYGPGYDDISLFHDPSLDRVSNSPSFLAALGAAVSGAATSVRQSTATIANGVLPNDTSGDNAAGIMAARVRNALGLGGS